MTRTRAGKCRMSVQIARLDAMVLEDHLDSIAGDVVTETREPTADARVAPSRVLRRHADHQRGEIRLGARATTASRLRAIVFLGHERPIPAQDGVRCDDTRDARQSAPAKNLAFHGQAAALIVGDWTRRGPCAARGPRFSSSKT